MTTTDVGKTSLACDCHMHVFGPLERYPAAPERSYTPREASLADWRRMAERLGLQRLVIVQPSAYGTDNRCMLDALRAAGPGARGIAALDLATTDSELRQWHAAGVRGIRLNPKSVGARQVGALKQLIIWAAKRIAPLGWHVQLYAELEQVVAAAEAIRVAATPVVLDHMGGARADADPAALRPLLDLLAAGRCWVKLSGAYRVSRHPSDFSDAVPLAQALVRANPTQLVWGTDWPHTAAHAGRPGADPPLIEFRDLDQAALLDLLAQAAGDSLTLNQILTDNPARLYGW